MPQWKTCVLTQSIASSLVLEALIPSYGVLWALVSGINSRCAPLVNPILGVIEPVLKEPPHSEANPRNVYFTDNGAAVAIFYMESHEMYALSMNASFWTGSLTSLHKVHATRLNLGVSSGRRSCLLACK